MKIRIFGFEGDHVNKTERWLRKAAEAHGQDWSFVGVFEMLEVARKQVPPHGIGIEANGGMIYRGSMDEAQAEKVVVHILNCLQRQEKKEEG